VFPDKNTLTDHSPFNDLSSPLKVDYCNRMSDESSHCVDTMNQFNDLELLRGTSDETMRRILTAQSESDDALFLKQQLGDDKTFRDSTFVHSQFGNGVIDSQATLLELTRRHRAQRLMGLNDSRLDTARRIDNERRNLMSLEKEFYLQEQLQIQIREELLKRKLQEAELLQRKREFQKIAVDQLFPEFHGMEQLVASHSFRQNQSEIINMTHRPDPSGVAAALGIFGRNGLNSEHFTGRNGPSSFIPDALGVVDNRVGTIATDTQNKLKGLSSLHEINGIDDFTDTQIAQLWMNQNLASSFPRGANQSPSRNVTGFAGEVYNCKAASRGLLSHNFLQNNTSALKNQMISNSNHGNTDLTKINEQMINQTITSNSDHPSKKIKLSSNNSNDITERSSSLPNNIRYFNNGIEINFRGSPIANSNVTDSAGHNKRTFQQSISTTSPFLHRVISSQSDLSDLKGPTCSKETMHGSIGVFEGGSNLVTTNDSHVTKKSISRYPQLVNSKEGCALRKPECVPSNENTIVSSVSSKIQLSLSEKHEKQGTIESPIGPHSDLIKEVISDNGVHLTPQPGSSKEAEEEPSDDNLSEERENTLTAASALLGFMKPGNLSQE